MTLTIEQVKANGWLVFEAIVGSRAYGLDTDKSDTDIRGVFVLPKDLFYSMDYTAQVSNESNDIVYYELKRFIELLAKNNPNILEMLQLPETCVLFRHELMNRIKPDMFLSRLCEKSFANYAYTQIQKARGLEKKIVNPVDPKRKQVLDFCFVYEGKGAMSLQKFLDVKGYRQEELGLSAVPHFRDCYNLFYSQQQKYAGVMRQDANDVCLSNIPENEPAIGLLYFNRDGYSVYCKKYREYWDWVEKRNEERYKTTMSHGKNYDAKNMMHVFRLLFVAKEIAVEGRINVWRKDREFLLNVKMGKYEYDDLVNKAESLRTELNELYQQSSLVDEPDLAEVNKLLVEMREAFDDIGLNPAR